MRRPIVIVTLFVAMLFSILPVQAADHDDVMAPTDGAMFYALSRMPAGTQSDLKALPDDDLGAIVGAAGGVFVTRRFTLKLGVVVQTIVCVVRTDVRQSKSATTVRQSNTSVSSHNTHQSNSALVSNR